MSRTTYLNGLAAEEIAQRVYQDHGYKTREMRWRSAAGEIDLIVATPDVVVFVEVKARKSHDQAAAAISSAQWARIMASAEIYMAQAGFGVAMDLRFDAALIDGQGVCQIIENAPVM